MRFLLLGKLFYFFVRLSKKFSRARLYEWLRHEVDIVNSSISRASVILNIGAGGEIYKVLDESINSKVIQVDVDLERKPDIVADVCDMESFADGSVDVVFMMEVLEHVKTPQAALDEIRRVLKSGGTLVLSTPFIFPIHDEPYDFYRFTKYGLEHLLRDFEGVVIKERNDYLHAIMVLFARAMMSKKRTFRYLGLIVFIYALIQYPFLWLFSKIYTDTRATTGYFVTAKA